MTTGFNLRREQESLAQRGFSDRTRNSRSAVRKHKSYAWEAKEVGDAAASSNV
jgi:hypothetical protein